MTESEQCILHRCWKALRLAPAGAHRENVFSLCGGVLMAIHSGHLEPTQRHPICVRMLIDAEDYLRNCVPAYELGADGVLHLEIVKDLESKKRWSREYNGWKAKP